MRIGILQAGHYAPELQPRSGDYDAMFRRLFEAEDFTFRTWNVVDGDFPASPAEMDGWLITGSRHGAYDDLPWIAPLEDLIRAIHAAGAPLVGICFGHQIIAQALGGKVVKYPGGWSVGRREYDWQGETVALNAWHQDQVVTLPPGARAIASNDFCENAAIVYGNSIMTVQAHPEFGEVEMTDMLRVRAEKAGVPDEIVEAATATAQEPTDRARIGARLAAFLRGEHERLD